MKASRRKKPKTKLYENSQYDIRQARLDTRTKHKKQEARS